MGKKILIVEDEFLVALNLRQSLSALGFETLGIAPDALTAFQLASAKPDIALVDVNLRDGETGPQIGHRLANEYGAVVLFLTANPAQLGEGIAGTVGFLCKPVDHEDVQQALNFLVTYPDNPSATPPSSLRIFGNDNEFRNSGNEIHRNG